MSARIFKNCALSKCSGAADDSCLCPWIEALPKHVHLPFLYFSDADVAACQDADVIREAAAIRSNAEATFEVSKKQHTA